MSKEYHAEYRRTHKEHMKELQKRWRENNRARVNQIALQSWHRRKKLTPVDRVSVDDEIPVEVVYPKFT